MPLNRFKDRGLPDIEGFSADPQEILTRLISQYEQAYRAETGEAITLATGSKVRIWLYTVALQQYLLENLVRYWASQNYLAYGVGESLDHISATRGGPQRDIAQKAVVTMSFTFSEPLKQAVVIPSGTRVTGNGNVYFELVAPCAVDAGNTSWEHIFTCQTAGIAGNGFLSGQISTLVDPLPYVQSVVNLDASQGGADVQSDDAYAELVYLSPEGFSVAGPGEAYEYLAKKYSATIMDVMAYQSAAGEITVVPLLQGGEIPEPAFLNGLLQSMSGRKHRPLTDLVHTAAPTVTNYAIEFTWYLEAGAGEQQAVQAQVERAVGDYVSWQKGCMGRDINPQELIRRVLEAGAKRLVVKTPVYTAIEPHGVAVGGVPVITFGGVENA